MSVRYNPETFRAYDVRGIAMADDPAEIDLTPEFAGALGKAYGTVIVRGGGSRVCLGRDCRLSGPALHQAFRDGLVSTGLTVQDIGVVSTPQLYFSVFHTDADGGVQITGSHNPGDYNGFKMMRGKGSLHGDAIQELRALIDAADYEVGQGSVVEEPVYDAYIQRMVEGLNLGERKLKVVVDGGNGTGGPPAVDLLERLGVEVVPLYIPMDGTFPNHHPDPTVEHNLQDLIAKVRETGADLGVAYDGDADRIGVVDDQGAILWGDRLMILLSRAVLAQCPGAAIVGEVKCSDTLFDAIAEAGGRPIMSKVGHSIIKERMKAEDAQLGGEMSGHIFFRHRWYGFDDAVYASGRLLEIVSAQDQPMSALLADVPVTHVTPEIRLDCPDAVKFRVVDAAVAHFSKDHEVEDIDGARVRFANGWGLIRASNTQPVLVLRAEATDAQALAEIRGTLESFVAAQA